MLSSRFSRAALAGGTSLALVTALNTSCSDDPPADNGAVTTDAGSDGLAPDDGGMDTGWNNSNGSEDYRSGTRLRAKVIGTADGPSLFLGWHDTKLDIDCAFQRIDDKQFRCVPTAGVGSTFSDVACKDKAVQVQTGCAVPKYGVSYPSCDAQVSVTRVGAKIAGAATSYTKQTASCEASPITAGFDLYAATESVGLDQLASATLARQPRGARLSMDVLVAEDGATQALAPYDTTRQAPCTTDVPFDKNFRCVPRFLAFEEVFFSDSECKTSIAFGPSYGEQCNLPPNVILRNNLPPPACTFSGPTNGTYAELGAKITTTVFRRDFAAGPCEAATGSASDSYFAIGAAVPITSFAAYTEVEEGTATARIKLRATKSETGERLIGRVFFDSERKEECRATPAADGVTRCLPLSNGATQLQYFSDAVCKSPLAWATTGCTPPAFGHSQKSTGASSGCDGDEGYVVQIFKIGAKVTPPATIYFLNGGTTCTETTLPPGSDLFDASIEVPASSYAQLTKKTE